MQGGVFRDNQRKRPLDELLNTNQKGASRGTIQNTMIHREVQVNRGLGDYLSSHYDGPVCDSSCCQNPDCAAIQSY